MGIRHREDSIKARQVARLKAQLADTDYMITTSMEYHLAGLEPPYDIPQLHGEREAVRKMIRETESGE